MSADQSSKGKGLGCWWIPLIGSFVILFLVLAAVAGSIIYPIIVAKEESNATSWQRWQFNGISILLPTEPVPAENAYPLPDGLVRSDHYSSEWEGCQIFISRYEFKPGSNIATSRPIDDILEGLKQEIGDPYMRRTDTPYRKSQLQGQTTVVNFQAPEGPKRMAITRVHSGNLALAVVVAGDPEKSVRPAAKITDSIEAM